MCGVCAYWVSENARAHARYHISPLFPIVIRCRALIKKARPDLSEPRVVCRVVFIGIQYLVGMLSS